MNPEIIETGDGSHTLYIESLQEHFHSTYGAINESMHIFVNCGFNYVEKEVLSILEIGFGTGLNCLLTAMRAMDTNKDVTYIGLDKFPLNQSILKKLNYCQFMEGAFSAYESINQAPWGNQTAIFPKFSLGKFCVDVVTDPIISNTLFDLVYFDAFAPAKQPGMWSSEVFRKISELTGPDGVIVTYSSKGDVRRSLQEAGFKMEKLPGPTGKREILRGRKKTG